MGLGSQGAVIVSGNRQWLFAVNAGSDDISVFRIEPGGLTLTDRVASGGDFPVSLTFSGGLLYVLNGGGAGNITGFRLDPSGTLTPLAGSTRPLSGAETTAPAQISFTEEGRVLVVTEKATNKIDTYLVGPDGLAGGPTVQNSQGETPFGFGIIRPGVVIVSEAFGGAPGAGTMSSYGQSGGSLSLISGSVPDFQAAPCWVAITPSRRFAYTTNTGSNSISSYRVAADGRLELLRSVAGQTGEGSAPTDMAITGRFLFALNQAGGEVDVFGVRGDGRLVYRSSVGGLPPFAVGLAER
jgi:6-phosphogluconolactonase (cycloisomerase 2 family)